MVANWFGMSTLLFKSRKTYEDRSAKVLCTRRNFSVLLFDSESSAKDLKAQGGPIDKFSKSVREWRGKVNNFQKDRGILIQA